MVQIAETVQEKMEQLTKSARQNLEKQHYRIVGSHSAVKVCGWTKKMLKGEGGCYKLKFYGIMSHQCLQMTTSISCANRCTFCWRDYKAPVSKDWTWSADEPELILKQSIAAHHKLLLGFKGHSGVNRKLWEASNTVKHVALSLTGEPITYPKINELIRLFNKEAISTFLVTNAQYPEQIRDLEPVTQLYLSIDAPNKELLKKVDVPLFSDYWERMIESLRETSKKKYRTCVRLTIVKGLTDVEPENYAGLIKIGNPDFIEVKGYMFVGASKERLELENMPWHEDVVSFSEKLASFLPGWEIVTEHVPSRVVLLAKKKVFIDGKWKTWIDFEKWNRLVNSDAPDSDKSIDVMDYLKATPQVGLSGRITKKEVEDGVKKEKAGIKMRPKKRSALIKAVYVDEKTDELDFWKKEKNETS